MVIRKALWSMIVLGTVLLAGCPVSMQVKLLNGGIENIDVLSGYSDAVLAEIAPGERKEAIYNFDCFRVRAGGVLYEFKPIVPPAEYINTGAFSSSFEGEFTADRKLKIYPSNHAPEKSIELPAGCTPEIQ
jgi:hypothetical protein